MRAAADRDPVGIAGDHAHGFDWHAKPFGDELGKTRLMTLALRHHADDELDHTFRQHNELYFLARHAGGNVDVSADADAAILAAPTRFAAALLEARPVAELERHLHGADVIAIVVFDARRIAIRQFLFGHEIAAANGNATEAELARGEIDQPLDHENHFRPARAAIRPRRRGIAQGRPRAEMRRRYPVNARHHLNALLHHGEIGGVGAEIAEIGAAHSQETALVVERQLGFDDEIARLIVAQERLVALDDPFHRPAELARRPGDGCKFRIDHTAGAEIAADIGH